MTIDAMHLEVRQRLQRAGADFYGNLQDEAIDFWLNATEDRLVTSISAGMNESQGFVMQDDNIEVTPGLLAAIEPIVVRRKLVQASVDDGGEGGARMVYPYSIVVMPPRLDHLLSAEALTVLNCKANINAAGQSITVGSASKYIAVFEIDDHHGLVITDGSTTYYDSTDYPFPARLTDRERQEIIQHILQWAPENFTYSGSPVEVYYERYGSVYRRSSLILVTEDEAFRDALQVRHALDVASVVLSTDPDLDDPASWTLGTGWAIASGVGTYTAGSGTGSLEKVFDAPLPTGKGYAIQVVTTTAAANLKIYTKNASGVATLIQTFASVSPGSHVAYIPAGTEIAGFAITGENAGGTFSVSYVALHVGSAAKATLGASIVQPTASHTDVIPVIIEGHEEFGRSETDPFRRPDRLGSRAAISDGRVIVCNAKNSLVKGLLLTFVRTRRRMSLALNQSTELPKLAPRLIGETVTALHEAMNTGQFQTSTIQTAKSN